MVLLYLGEGGEALGLACENIATRDHLDGKMFPLCHSIAAVSDMCMVVRHLAGRISADRCVA